MSVSKRAVVLLSGGLDSATCLAVAVSQGYECHTLAVNYGQRHSVELQSAKKIADALGAASFTLVPLDLRLFGGSALTDAIEVPKDREPGQGIPVTYVPVRNTLFLSLALARAETLGAFDIFLGVNAVDYSGYPDCRPEFIAAFEKLANLATKAGVEGLGTFTIHAPLQNMTKAEIIRAGTTLGVPYASTHSCYDPTTDGLACGRCESCILRRRGFLDAGLPDPTRYAP